jgi:hypothetical protein
VFEQLQSNDLVFVSSSESRVCRVSNPSRNASARPRSQGPHCHTHCSHRLSKSGPTRSNHHCSVGALQNTQMETHRQGTTELPGSLHHPIPPPKTPTTGILRGRHSTSGPPPTQGLSHGKSPPPPPPPGSPHPPARGPHPRWPGSGTVWANSWFPELRGATPDSAPGLGHGSLSTPQPLAAV